MPPITQSFVRILCARKPHTVQPETGFDGCRSAEMTKIEKIHNSKETRVSTVDEDHTCTREVAQPA